MQPVLIILQTYARTAYALQTVKAVKANLSHTGGLKWYVTDDGSEASHVQQIQAEIGAENIAGIHSRRISYGACANVAQRFANANGYDLTLWLEDDWELMQPLDLTPYAAVLEQHQDVGMVRLGRLPPWLDCHTDAYDGYIYLHFQNSTPYAFSGNPSLRHRRFSELFGVYPEREQPGETERIYDSYIRATKGDIKIVRPVDLGTYGPWRHIGDVKSF